MLKVMSAITFPSTNTDLIPVVSKYRERQQIRVNKANRVSDLILGRDDKEGNKMVRSAMRTIKHSNIRERLGHVHSRFPEGDAIVRKMTSILRLEG